MVGKVALLDHAAFDVDAAVQRRASAQDHRAFHLLRDDPRVDDGAAVERADDAMHARLPVGEPTPRPPARRCCRSSRAARRRAPRLAGSGAGRQPAFSAASLQHRGVARRVLQQREAERDRVLLRRERELVDERLGEERVVRMADRAPEADRHAAVRGDVRDALVRDARRAGRTGLRWWSCRACRSGRRAPACTRSIQRGVIASPALWMRSAVQAALCVEAGAQQRGAGRAVEVVREVFFARPRPAAPAGRRVSMRDAHRLADEVDLEPAAEAAAEVGDVHRDGASGSTPATRAAASRAQGRAPASAPTPRPCRRRRARCS